MFSCTGTVKNGVVIADGFVDKVVLYPSNFSQRRSLEELPDGTVVHVQADSKYNIIDFDEA